MSNYIIEKLKNDGLNLLNHSKNEEKIQHDGLRGRLRELLINKLLSSWLPPYVLCGTGTVIAANDVRRKHTQDDVILFDKSLVPPILGAESINEGVFLYNSVLAIIEVKSTASTTAYNNFCTSCKESLGMKFSVRDDDIHLITPYNIFFAYKSDTLQGEDFELKRLIKAMKAIGMDPLSGIVSMICIPGKGFWKLIRETKDGPLCWGKLDSDKEEDHIAWFIGCVSSSCFEAHVNRQGRDISKSLEMGIGSYIPDNVYKKIDIQNF